MPQTKLRSSPELAIVLDKETAFIGGETIYGHVLQKSPFVAQDTSVFVRLYGRTKVKMIFSGGLTHSEYRSRFNFFGGSSEVHKIDQGPIHTQPNSPECGKWPFAIELPKNPNLASLRAGNENERSYLPLNDVSLHGLPPTFYVKANSPGRFVEGYIEYYLEATLLCNSKEKCKRFQATRPLSVRSVSSQIPITDFNTKHLSGVKTRIASQCLVLGVDSKLSVGQKMKKMLGSSQIPGYSFSLQSEFATVLQMGNPNTIPLRLRVNPIWEDTSEILQKRSPPLIFVKRFTLALLSTTHYTCKRLRMKSGELKYTSSLILAEYARKQIPRERHDANTTLQKDQLKVPSSADVLVVPQDSTSSPMDLGTVLGIRTPMESRGAQIYPTFTTYNMKNEHHLEWRLELIIAGETVRFEGKESVNVIGPSYIS